MRWIFASIAKHLEISWGSRSRLASRLAGCFLFVTLATVFVRAAPISANHLIWVGNGVMLAYLLVVPRRLWPAFLIAGFAAQMTGSLLGNRDWRMNLLLTLLNMTEVLISAFLLRRQSADLPHFANRKYLIRFFIFGALVGPLAAGAIYVFLAHLLFVSPQGVSFFEWIGADGLGALVATPACVAIFRTHFNRTLSSGKDWWYLLLLVGATLISFSQTRVPMLFLLYPLLILVLLRLGMGWASIATLFVAGVGSWCTIRNQGPFVSSSSLTPLEPSITLQVFIASAMFMLYSVSVVLESRRAAQRQLKRIASLHALVTENSRDVIVLVDFDGRPRYISSAVHALTGWRPDETMDRGFAEVAHPEDLPKIEAAINNLREGAEAAVIEYRLKRRSGGYVWVEGSLRALRESKTGNCTGILQMVRDISERKEAEQKLQEAYRAVETLAITDALTGLANRRRFDQCLTTEWRRGLRDRNPVAMLLIDVDLFKSYNDTYGHVRGDSCLKQIAEAAMDVVTRPGDLVARFGGEEFAIILPNTGSEGAVEVANNICDGLRSRQLAHSGNPAGFLTISVGCAALVPSLGQHAIDLIELADAALYEAKRRGRNRVCRSQTSSEIAEGPSGKELPEMPIGKTA